MPTTIAKRVKGVPAACSSPAKDCLVEPCFHQDVPGTGAVKKGASAKAKTRPVAMSGSDSSAGTNNRALIKAISDSKVYQ